MERSRLKKAKKTSRRKVVLADKLQKSSVEQARQKVRFEKKFKRLKTHFEAERMKEEQESEIPLSILGS